MKTAAKTTARTAAGTAAKTAANRDAKRVLTGLAFLGPNLLGVLVFVVFPVGYSVVLAFTNWDVTLHNMWRPENRLRFVGLDNFVRLVTEADFFRFLGNTLFMMLAIPFGIGASLIAAMLLSRDTRGGSHRVWAWLMAGSGLIVGVTILAAVGLGATGMTLLVLGVAGAVLVAGVGGGVTVYRTLFYAPHFTAGVATFILWKKLYAPQNGPINDGLTPVLDGLGAAVNATGAWPWWGGFWLLMALATGLLAWSLRTLYRQWDDGDIGLGTVALAVAVLLIPVLALSAWQFGVPTGVPATRDARYAAMARQVTGGKALLIVTGLLTLAALKWRAWRRGRAFGSRLAEGFGSGLVLSLAVLTGLFALSGGAAVMLNLPTMASAPDSLTPPAWLNDIAWAKPSLMMMGFWAAIGSNNMLLYLAALTNVPEELYEASDIDGAGPFGKFWNVTWPQLAPTTFFIAVMSVIGGLQGGFEAARTMTGGGPAGATTTLAYFIYTEGFETGRLSFASAVAWALFVLVFAVTMFNWTFGNRYVNE